MKSMKKIIKKKKGYEKKPDQIMGGLKWKDEK